MKVGLPDALYTPDAVAQLDKLATASMPSDESLMERAGQCIADFVRKTYPKAHRAGVLCGAGNNAGDGYVIARCLHTAGCAVQVATLADPHLLPPDAKAAHASWEATGLAMSSPESVIAHSEVIVDALLGTGLSKPLTEDWQQCIAHVNDSRKPIVSVDVPSGLCARTGQPQPIAVKADHTCCVLAAKVGLLTGDAFAHTGTLHFDDLGIAVQDYPSVHPIAYQLTDKNCPPCTPPNPAAHKKSFGHVLIIGGNLGYSGAVLLAAEAALRAGAGCVSVLTHDKHAIALDARVPEVMIHSIDNTVVRQQLLQDADVLILGPGMGNDSWAKKHIALALSVDQPTVLDAQALDYWIEHPKTPWPSSVIITPHPGEAGRLLNQHAATIQADRLSALNQLQPLVEGTVVLKGAGTLITDGLQTALLPVGNPGMAIPGSGDVLAGLIGALWARQNNPFIAAKQAACLHAEAAKILSPNGQRGRLAQEWLAYVPPVLERMTCP